MSIWEKKLTAGEDAKVAFDQLTKRPGKAETNTLTGMFTLKSYFDSDDGKGYIKAQWTPTRKVRVTRIHCISYALINGASDIQYTTPFVSIADYQALTSGNLPAVWDSIPNNLVIDDPGHGWAVGDTYSPPNYVNIFEVSGPSDDRPINLVLAPSKQYQIQVSTGEVYNAPNDVNVVYLTIEYELM